MSIEQFLLALVPSLLLCFFGLKLRRLAMAVIFFGIGFYLIRDFGGPYITNSAFLLTTEIACGLILAAISFSIEKLAIFIVVSYAGFQFMASFLDTSVWYYFLVAIAVGVILGAISAKFYKTMIILATSYIGALEATKVIIPYFSLASQPYFFLCIIALFLLGTIFQFNTNQNIPITG